MGLLTKLFGTRSERELKKMLAKGFFIATCKALNSGKVYKGKFTVAKEDKKDKTTGEMRTYCNVKCDFA